VPVDKVFSSTHHTVCRTDAFMPVEAMMHVAPMPVEAKSNPVTEKAPGKLTRG